MSKIFNQFLKNKRIATSYGEFEFDVNGVAEMEPECAERLSQLKGYSIVDENTENSSSEDDGDKSSEEDENDQNEDVDGLEESLDDEELLTEEQLEKLNVPQLKKIAKDNDINLNGATKKDEIICILLGSQN